MMRNYFHTRYQYTYMKQQASKNIMLLLDGGPPTIRYQEWFFADLLRKKMRSQIVPEACNNHVEPPATSKKSQPDFVWTSLEE